MEPAEKFFRKIYKPKLPKRIKEKREEMNKKDKTILQLYEELKNNGKLNGK